MFHAFNAFANNTSIKTAKESIIYFDSLSIKDDKIKITSKSRIGKIRKNQPDNVKIWGNTIDFSSGDTIRIIGGQINLYWQLLEIKKNKVKFYHFGFERGKGPVDEKFWVKEF